MAGGSARRAAAVAAPLISLWLPAAAETAYSAVPNHLLPAEESLPADVPVHAPEQIHIGLGYDPSEMTVHWTTMQPSGEPHRTRGDPYSLFGLAPSSWLGGESFVKYGPSPSSLTEVVEGRQFQFRDYGTERRTYSMHVATMRGLAPSKKYYYAVGGNSSGWSIPYGFKSAPSAATLQGQLPMTYAVYGDLGDYNAQSLQYLVAAAQRGEFDMVLHVGDFAYDMHDDNGRNGDAFMRDIEPLAAIVPYMVCVGNHEYAQNFNHYTQRFRNMPSNSGNISYPEFGRAPNNWWYSWDSGLVHFVALSTEIYFMNFEQLPAQYEWLERDLAGVDRSRTPWIVVHGHRPLYCSCDGDCDTATRNRMGVWQTDGTQKYGLEKLFYKHGVDLYIAGHEHNYERMYDVAPRYNATAPWLSGVTTRSTEDPPATTYIVTGSAGNVERHEPFTRKSPARSAKRLNTYGWSKMTVHNATHLLWQQFQTDDGEPAGTMDKVMDEAWIVQRHHGPFTRHPRRRLLEEARGEEEETGDAGERAERKLGALERRPSRYGAAECRKGPGGEHAVCQDEVFHQGLRKLGSWQFTRGLRHPVGEALQVLSI